MNLKLIKLQEEHLPLVMDWRMRPYITKYMNTDPKLTLEDQKKWLQKIDSDDSQLYWIILFDEQPIGLVSLINIDRINLHCSWGYYIAELEKRSLKLAMYLEWNIYDYVFDKLKLNKLCNETFVENEYVVKLHQLCGSHQDGIMRQQVCKNGQFYDVSVGSITVDEWLSIRKNIEYEKFLFVDDDMEIDHIGYLTYDIIKALDYFRKFGNYVPITEIIKDDIEISSDGKKRNVNICFLKSPNGYVIELISPLDESSVINNILKRQGSGAYHICYRTGDINSKLKFLKEIGWIVVQEPMPAVAFKGAKVAFLFNNLLGLIELLEWPYKMSLLLPSRGGGI